MATRGFIREYRHRRGPAVSWQVTVELGKDPLTGGRRRHTQSVQGSREQAERVLTQMLRDLDTGQLADPRQETVGAFLDRWLRDHAKRRCGPRTVRRYAEIVDLHLKPALGHIRLQKLQPSDILRAEAAWLDGGSKRKAGRPLSAQTVHHHHAVLRAALERAVKWGDLVTNPAKRVDPPRVERVEIAVLDVAQATVLLDHVRGTEWEAVVTTKLFTGLRLSELLALRWSDLDLTGTPPRLWVRQTQRREGGEVHYGPPKTRRSRRPVELDGSLADVLREHRAAQVERRLTVGEAWEEGDLVFPDEVGRPLDGDRLRRAFYALLTEAGLPRVRLHDLRHTHASLLLAGGEHLKVVSERLGHSGIQITADTYSHVVPGLQAQAAERLARMLGRGSQGAL